MQLSVKNFNKGNLISKWKQNDVRVKIYDGALLSSDRSSPEIATVMERISRIGFRVAQQACELGKDLEPYAGNPDIVYSQMIEPES